MRPRRLGMDAWLVQPLYVVVELLVAAAATTSYSLRDDTISALGQLTCGPGRAGSTLVVCSPAHAVLDGAFVAFGLLRVVGALLVQQDLAQGWGRLTATWLWVVSGLCSAAVGFVPVDQYPGPHAMVAAPVFVLQPVAVLATSYVLRRTGAVPSAVVTSGYAVGAMTLVASAAFGLGVGGQAWVGVLERLALWPAYLWLGVVGAALLAHSRTSAPRRVSAPR